MGSCGWVRGEGLGFSSTSEVKGFEQKVTETNS